MLNLAISLVTFLSIVAVTVYMAQQNRLQDQRTQKHLQDMVASVNTQNAAAEQVVKKQNDTLGGINSSLTDVRGNITTLQSSVKDTNTRVDGLKDIYATKADTTKSFDDLKNVYVNKQDSVKAFSALSNVYLSQAAAAKSLQSDQGTFSKVTVGDRTLFVNNNLLSVDKGGLSIPGDVNLNGTTLATTAGAFHINAGSNNLFRATPTGSTVRGNLNVDGVTLGRFGNEPGLYAPAASNPAPFVKFAANREATFGGPVKTSGMVFLPDGADVFSITRNAQARTLQARVPNGQFDIGGSNNIGHTFFADGRAYHAGPVAVGTSAPHSNVLLHLRRDNAPASLRMEQGPRAFDLGLNPQGAFLNTSNQDITFSTNGQVNARINAQGNTVINGSLCVGNQCIQTNQLQDLLTKAQQINAYLSNLTFDPSGAKFTRDTICVNGTCINADQVRRLLALESRATPVFSNILSNQPDDLVFNKRGRFQNSLCFEDVCWNKSTAQTVLNTVNSTVPSLNQTIQTQTNRINTLEAQNQQFLRQMQEQKAYFDNQLKTISTTLTNPTQAPSVV